MKPGILLLAFAAAVLSSCTVTRYYIADNYILQSVDDSRKNNEVQSNTYADENISVTVEFGTTGIAVQLTNLSNSSLKIPWDDAAYIDRYGNAHRVIHIGTKLIDRDKAQVPSVVPKGASLSDEVVPSDCISWTNGSKYYPGEWKYLPIIQMIKYETREQAEIALESSADKTPQLLFPIETGGKRYEYTFKFSSKSSSINTVSEFNPKSIIWGVFGIGLVSAIVEIISTSAL